jgi:hypothetical protein
VTTPIVIPLRADGVRDVMRALQSVEEATLRHERAIAREQQRAARERQRALDREAREKVRAMRFADREVERANRQAVREVERAEREKTRAAEREARERVRVMQAADRDVARAREQALRQMMREEERANREAMRWVRQREAEQRRLDERLVNRRVAFAQGVVGSAAAGFASGANRVVGLAGGMVNAAIGLGGGFSLPDVLRDRAELERSAAQLANSSFIPPSVNADGTVNPGVARPDKAAIIARARAVQAATNIDAAELIAGTKAYVAKASDFAGGMANMEFFAKLAKASGTDFQDVMKTAGILRVQNKDLGAEAMKSMMLNIVAQGKQGAVEFEDLATVAGKVTRSSAAYALDQAEAQSKLLALAQVAIRTSGSPEEAATVLSNLSQDALKHRGRMPAGVFDARGKILDPAKMITTVFEASGGNMGTIQDMGFGSRSMKMFQALSPIFEEAYKSTKGSEQERRKAGAKAVAAEMEHLAGARYSEQLLNEDFRNVMDTAAEKADAAMKQFKDTLATELLPEFVRLIPVLKEVTPAFMSVMKNGVPAFAQLIESVAKFVRENEGLIKSISAHPIGAIIAAEVVGSIAKAGIGGGVRAVIEAAIRGGAGAGGGGGVGGAGAFGAAGTAGAAGLLAGAATAAYLGPVAEAAVTGNAQGSDRSASMFIEIGNIRSALGSGHITKDEATRRMAKLQQELDAAKAHSGRGEQAFALKTLGINTIRSVVTGERNESLHTIREVEKNRQLLEQEQQLTAALRELATAIQSKKSDQTPDRLAPMSSPSRGGPVTK